MTLHDHSALELAALVRKREVSPLELVDHYLDRVDRLNERLGAFLTVTADRARDEARVATARVAAGDESLPALFGVPTAIKDLTPVEGVRTTMGSAVFVDFVPSYSGPAALQIEAAGLISLGKTNTPEFGAACYTANDIGPEARTPWDEARSASGSSGGAAAAVAGGLVPIAHGSDGTGSIRTPASVCGLVGFKPSRGVTAMAPDFIAMGTDGPLARTVADAAALLDVLATHAPGGLHPSSAPADGYLVAAATPVAGRLVIGRCLDPGADVPVAPACVTAVDATARLLGEMGHDVVEIDNPMAGDSAALTEALVDVLAVSAAAGLESMVPAGAHGALRPLTRWLIERAGRLTAVQHGVALKTVAAATSRALTRLGGIDAVLTPTVAGLPPLVGALRDDGDPAREYELMGGWSVFTPAWSLTGQPAASLPLHWTDSGLPVGIQLIGRRGEDGSLLALAAALEAARPWRDRVPAVWAA